MLDRVQYYGLYFSHQHTLNFYMILISISSKLFKPEQENIYLNGIYQWWFINQSLIVASETGKFLSFHEGPPKSIVFDRSKHQHSPAPLPPVKNDPKVFHTITSQIGLTRLLTRKKAFYEGPNRSRCSEATKTIEFVQPDQEIVFAGL